MAMYYDATLPFGIDSSLCVVGVPVDVARWKFQQRAKSIPWLYLKFKDGRFEQWSVEYTDETRRAVKPGKCYGKNTTRVTYK